MEDKDLIDSEITESPQSSLLNMVKWWEWKRMSFNFFLIILIGIQFFIYSAEIQVYGFPNAIGSSITYLVAANCLYCSGWGIEILMKVYFNLEFSAFFRWVCLVSGILFSFLLTFWAFSFEFSNFFDL